MAIALVSNTAVGVGANGSTTSAINTSGTTLLVLAVSYYATGTTAPTVSDSKSNTLQSITSYVFGDMGIKLFYTTNPIVGASHTFTVAATGAYPSVAVSAFSGTANAAYDAVNGGGAASTTAQPGSIFPTSPNDLIFSAVALRGGNISSVSTGFTLLNTIPTNATQGMGAAYQIQAAAAAVNPTWTGTDSSNKAAVVIAFKPAVALAFVTTTPLPDATAGVPYSATIQTSGRTGALEVDEYVDYPVGLGSIVLNGDTATISGTPTQAGVFDILLGLLDGNGTYVSKNFALTVNAAPPSITSNSPLPTATVNQSYSVQLAKTGAAGTWSAPAASNLPASALSASGLITIPVVGSSNYTFTARFTQTAGGAFVEKAFTIPVSALAPITLCYRRPLAIDYIQRQRFFEPIAGDEEIIEDAPVKREFTMTILWLGFAEGDALRQFLYNHRKREPFLWLNPDRNNEAITVKMVSKYTEAQFLAYGDFEIVLREV